MPRRRRTKPGDGPEVLIIGGGFAGISALEVLGRSRVRVTLVDRNIYSTFQPLLYQVATAGLTAADVAYPLWSATGRRGARFRKGELAALDLGQRVAVLASGEKLSYDYLIVATGVSAAFYGGEGAAEHSISLYTRRDAITLRNQLMAALEKRNEGLTDPEDRHEGERAPGDVEIPAEQVDPGEGQVPGADHHRYQEVSKRGGNRRDQEEEDHHHAVHGEQLVVGVGVD